MPGVVYHPRYRDYCFGPSHPFSPLRLDMLVSLLETLDCPLLPITPPVATRGEVLVVHSEALVARVEAASEGHTPPDAHTYGLDTTDVPVFAGMDAAARGLVGGALQAARLVAEGAHPLTLHLGGGLHHARRNAAAGFCIYNDLSAAIHAFRARGLRVAYIDIDVHHGDGVQWLHYDDPDVLTISLHESGRYLYPGTGDIGELGEAAGKGFSLNVPLLPGTGDESYLEAFERVVPHTLAWFRPDVLLVQCGADAHWRDPLADLLLTTHAYERLFRRLLALAREHAGGQAVFTLGGGYDFDATVRVWALLYLILHDLPLPTRLPEAWRETWQERLARSLSPTLHDASPPPPPGRAEEINEQNRESARCLLERVVTYWY